MRFRRWRPQTLSPRRAFEEYFTCVSASLSLFLSLSLSIYIYTHTCVYVRAMYLCIHIYTHKFCIHTCIYIYIYRYIEYAHPYTCIHIADVCAPILCTDTSPTRPRSPARSSRTNCLKGLESLGKGSPPTQTSGDCWHCFQFTVHESRLAWKLIEDPILRRVVLQEPLARLHVDLDECIAPAHPC